ncbi:unnamed protein product [Laminaria digitata]
MPPHIHACRGKGFSSPAVFLLVIVFCKEISAWCKSSDVLSFRNFLTSGKSVLDRWRHTGSFRHFSDDRILSFLKESTSKTTVGRKWLFICGQSAHRAGSQA